VSTLETKYDEEVDQVRFECQPGCINCCEQEGYVYLTEEDLKRAAKFVRMTARAFETKYVYRTAHEMRFRKPRDRQCPFLLDRGCAIHPAKPEQCRKFPFWPELTRTKAAWRATARYCPGIGKGPLIQIEKTISG
jgi:Fe-S-cluster containining protein